MSWFKDLRRELRHHPPEELRRWFLDRRRLESVASGDRPFWLEEIAALLARSGAKGTAFLLKCIPEVDGVRLRAILVGLSLAAKRLSARNRAEICAQARGLLKDSRPLIAAEAVDTLNSLGCTDAVQDVLPLLEHRSPYVVGSVLRLLARYAPDRAVPLLLKALKSEEPIVRQNAIDELDELEYVRALPRIRKLLKDADSDVRQAALTAVENFQGLVRGR